MAVEIDPALKCANPHCTTLKSYTSWNIWVWLISIVKMVLKLWRPADQKKIKSMFFCHLILLFHIWIIFFLPFVYIKIIIFATIKCLNNPSACSWKVGQKMVGRLLESDGNGFHKGSPTTTNFTHQDKSCFRLLPAYIQLWAQLWGAGGF